ncbi:MAG: hypothetical protein RSC24_06415 [Clostridium sp.]
MAKRIFDLPQTKGEFKARGLITGTGKDKFYKEGSTPSKKDQNGKEIGLKAKRNLKFGIKVAGDGSTVYCDVQAKEQDNVYFYKKGNKKLNIKGESKAVNFGTRELFKEEGFEPIGIKVGIEQEFDEKGALKNINIPMFEFDSAKYLSENLTEDQAVFVRGKIEFSSYINGNTGDKVRMQKFIPTQVSGVTVDINLDDEKYVSSNDFIQTIIFMGIELDDNKDDKKGILSAKVVNYSTIEDVEFIVRDQKLFKTLKKNLKPYNAIRIFGKINNKLEQVVEDDGWGTSNNTFETKAGNFTRELLVLGANPETLDKETYTNAKVDEAIKLIRANQKAKEEFGEKTIESSTDDWGTSNKKASQQDEEEFEEGWG